MEPHLRYRELPSLPRLYLQGAVRRRKAPRGSFTPRISPMDARVDSVRAVDSMLHRYRELCRWPDDGELPLPFPHVLATPLHAALVMHRSFPYPVLGVVHVRQVMTQHAALPAGQGYAVYCRFGEEREARRGVEFDTICCRTPA